MTIEELLDKCINDKLIDLTISGPKKVHLKCLKR